MNKKKTPERPDGSASINRNDLWKYICQSKFLPNTNSFHILSVITIFFEELKEAMMDGEKIKIPNFITFYMSKRKPFNLYSPLYQKNVQIGVRYVFKMKLAPKLKNFLKRALDKNKTFGIK